MWEGSLVFSEISNANMDGIWKKITQNIVPCQKRHLNLSYLAFITQYFTIEVSDKQCLDYICIVVTDLFNPVPGIKSTKTLHLFS